MRLVLVGISHHYAPVELRERVAVALEGASELAGRLGDAVCLSTCNRTELYLAREDAVAGEAEAVEALVGLSGLPGADLAPALYRLRDGAAALHLFRVAAGLDSMIPGEGEILGQVRGAYEAGTPGALLDRLFRHALYVGKRVRSQTSIGESPSSVSAAAAALAQQVFGELEGRRILVVGAGKMSELTARNLVSRGASVSVVANRTLDRAEALAASVGGRALPLSAAAAELADADVVVSSTSAPGYVLTRGDVAACLRGRRGRPLFMIDLAVPRDVDPAIQELEGCYVYDIDDLQAVVSESLASRRREAVAAEQIVSDEAEQFRRWQASLDVVPAIASLRARAEDIRERELAKARGRLSKLSDAERNLVEVITSQIVNKLLHDPTVRMKEAAAASDGVLYADAVKHLFALDEDDR